MNNDNSTIPANRIEQNLLQSATAPVSFLQELSHQLTREWLSENTFSDRQVTGIPLNSSLLKICRFKIVRFRKPEDIRRGIMGFLDTVALFQRPFMYTVFCLNGQYHLLFGLAGQKEDDKEVIEYFKTAKRSIRGFFPGCKIKDMYMRGRVSFDEGFTHIEDLTTTLADMPYRVAITGIPSEKLPEQEKNRERTEIGLEELADAISEDFALIVQAIPLSRDVTKKALSETTKMSDSVHMYVRSTAQYSNNDTKGWSFTETRNETRQEGRTEGGGGSTTRSQQDGVVDRLRQNSRVWIHGGTKNQVQTSEQTNWNINKSTSTTEGTSDTKTGSTTSGISRSIEHTSKAANYLEELLNRMHKRLSSGSGLWSCFTEVCARQQSSADRIASLLCGILSGEDSRLEPLRFFKLPATAGPGNYMSLRSTEEHPLGPAFTQLASVLTTSELARITRLPLHDLPGISVEKLADYGRNWDTPAPDKDVIRLGCLIDREYETNRKIPLETGRLLKHCFVCGATGSGKSNTMRSLVQKLWQDCHIPFLVIEPVKQEYRELKQEYPDMRVFSLGDADCEFALNPFDFEPLVGLVSHIDLLKSAFQASLGMYSSMPFILEHLIYEAYRKRGWDLKTGRNASLEQTAKELGVDPNGSLRAQFLPRLSELPPMIDEAIKNFFSERGSDYSISISGALKARLYSLCQGSKGSLLDCRYSMPFKSLLEKPCVLELLPFADNEEKSFVMALLLMRLYEYRQAEGRREGALEGKTLQHLLIIEEAHRLLAKPTPSGEHSASGRQKGVEVFTDILAEIRSYGQGLVIVDQIPSKLVPDVLRNTDVKIAHRLVDKEDREILGATMNLADEHIQDLARFLPGQACIYYSGLRKVLHVKIDRAPLPQAKTSLKNDDASALAWEKIAAFGFPVDPGNPSLIHTETVLLRIVRVLASILLDTRRGYASQHYHRYHHMYPAYIVVDSQTTEYSTLSSEQFAPAFCALSDLIELLYEHGIRYNPAIKIAVAMAKLLKAWAFHTEDYEAYENLRKIGQTGKTALESILCWKIFCDSYGQEFAIRLLQDTTPQCEEVIKDFFTKQFFLSNNENIAVDGKELLETACTKNS